MTRELSLLHHGIMKGVFISGLSILMLATLSTSEAIVAHAEIKLTAAKQSRHRAEKPPQNDDSHCVKMVKLRFLEIYMQGDWTESARATAERRWRERVTKEYGSVYSDWAQSSNRQQSCKRIGFGNDDNGNVGRTIVCEISAVPCAKLTP